MPHGGLRSPTQVYDAPSPPEPPLPSPATRKCKFCKDDVPWEIAFSSHSKFCRELKQRRAARAHSPGAPPEQPRPARTTTPRTGASDSGGRTHRSRRVSANPSARPVGLPVLGSTETGRSQATPQRGEAVTSTGKRDSTQRSPSGNTEGMRSSSRHCPDNLSMASAPGSIEPVQIRLDDTVGHIFAITHTDAAKMGGQLRRLTHEEVSFGRLRILPIKDVAYWAELAVGGHRIYIVAVLTPESDAQHSSLGVYDLIISGIDTLPAAVHRTLRMSAIRL